MRQPDRRYAVTFVVRAFDTKDAVAQAEQYLNPDPTDQPVDFDVRAVAPGGNWPVTAPRLEP